MHTIIQAEHSTLHCSKVSFIQCGHMKIYNKIFRKM